MTLRQVFVLLGLLVAAIRPSHAGTTGFSYYDYTVIDNTAVTLNGPGLTNAVSGAGEILLLGAGPDSGRTLAVWDLDILTILQPETLPPPYTETFVTPAGLVIPGAPALTAAQIRQIGGLMAYGRNAVGTDALVSPAIQLAIWTIEYAGAYSYASSSPGLVTFAATLADDAISGIIPGSTRWEALIDPAQGNAVLAALVPEPAGTVLLLGALGPLGLLRGRRLRRA